MNRDDVLGERGNQLSAFQWAESDRIIAERCKPLMPTILQLMHYRPESTMSVELPITHCIVPEKMTPGHGYPYEAPARSVARKLEQTLFDTILSNPSRWQRVSTAKECLDRDTSAVQLALRIDIAKAIDDLQRNKFFGPYLVSYGSIWDRYLDCDAPSEQYPTLRRQLEAELKLTFLRNDIIEDSLLIIQNTSDVIRMVSVAEPKLVFVKSAQQQFSEHLDNATVIVRSWPKWKQGVLGVPTANEPDSKKNVEPTEGRFVVAASMAPQLRANINGNLGIAELIK